MIIFLIRIFVALIVSVALILAQLPFKRLFKNTILSAFVLHGRNSKVDS